MKFLITILLIFPFLCFADAYDSRNIKPTNLIPNHRYISQYDDTEDIAGASLVGFVACDALLQKKTEYSKLYCAGAILLANAATRNDNYLASAYGITIGMVIRYSWKF